VQHWKLHEIETPDGSRSPVVLHSQNGESRAVLIGLDAGQEMGEHEVKEAAMLLVVAGEARVTVGAETRVAGAGELFRFDPSERHSVSSVDGARLLLVLAPWPGDGHYRGGDAPVGASAS
jgi:quercetin dioxygenase-like cupin family protein